MQKSKINKFLKEFKIKYEINCSLKNHTTAHLGGITDFMVYPSTTEQFAEIIKFCNSKKIKYFILGMGSKVLFSDRRYRGIIINTLEFNKVQIDDEIVIAQSGAPINKIYNIAKSTGLQGINELIGIPASIGGAIFMNAGCYNKQISDVIVNVKYLTIDGELIVYSSKDIEFSYRKSIFQKLKGIILEATMKFERADKKAISETTNFFIKKRQMGQPQLKNSFGSTFKNAGIIPAWQLIKPLKEEIDQENIKISHKHANFIEFSSTILSINLVNFIVNIKQKVYNKHCLYLQEEVILVNFKAKELKISHGCKKKRKVIQ